MKRLHLLLLFIILCSSIHGQVRDIIMPPNSNKIDLPFEYVNDFIVVTMVFNGVFPLKFIFDTGAEHTIITKKEITDLLQVDYQRKFTLYGSDLSTEITAYLASGVSLRNNQFYAINRTILVLENDYFKFEEMTGFAIQGILGSDIFRRFVVKIDYRKKRISLYDPQKFSQPKKKFRQLPIDIHNHKPYLFAPTIFQNQSSINAKLLIDTGASIPLLFYTNTDSAISIPPKVVKSKLAMGLGGAIEGYLGRTNEIKICDYQMNDVITNYQELLREIPPEQINFRNGIIGNKLLSRFTFFIDYDNEIAYLKASRKLRKKFKYDRSGMIVIASGEELKTLVISEILPNSPAEEAGLQPGDIIRGINGTPGLFLSLADVNRKMRKKAGKKIVVRAIRDGKKFKTQFKLRDLI